MSPLPARGGGGAEGHARAAQRGRAGRDRHRHLPRRRGVAGAAGGADGGPEHAQVARVSPTTAASTGPAARPKRASRPDQAWTPRAAAAIRPARTPSAAHAASSAPAAGGPSRS